MVFPKRRLRRLRQNEQIRSMLAEVTLTPSDLIYPLFVRESTGDATPIQSMPGIFQYSLIEIGQKAREVQNLGIPAVILFGIPEIKDPLGKEAYNPQGVIQRAITEIREKAPNLIVIADCCLCEYTDHGHCGPVRPASHSSAGVPSRPSNEPDNDLTLELLEKTAVTQAAAGAHIIAPSGMIDGMVGKIRSALDREGHDQALILSYAVKYASHFYGPFREAAGSEGSFKGDRKTHQMDPRTASQAIDEVRQDLNEGADVIMVKPALCYLDIVRSVKDTFSAPIAVYNVSGEYSMIKAAAQNGWIDEKGAVLEMLTSIKRAGANMIVTYFAKDVVQWLE